MERLQATLTSLCPFFFMESSREEWTKQMGTKQNSDILVLVIHLCFMGQIKTGKTNKKSNSMCIHLLDLCSSWNAEAQWYIYHANVVKCLICSGRIYTVLNACYGAQTIWGNILVSEVVWRILVLMLNNKDLFPICKKLFLRYLSHLKGFFLHPLHIVHL